MSCVQLSDNVTLSTALALQRFIHSCDIGILQANNRSDVEAIKMPPEPKTVFAFARISNDAKDQAQNSTCGLCLPNLAQNPCCRHGVCSGNRTCQCDPG